jgi:hypothetical protein
MIQVLFCKDSQRTICTSLRLAASGLTSAGTAFADLSSEYADVAANPSSADRINALIIGCENDVNSRSAYQVFAIPKTKPLDCFPSKVERLPELLYTGRHDNAE